MKHIKEFFDATGEPIVSIYSFHDDCKLLYMVDVLPANHGDTIIFADKKDAIDYGQAMTNNINRKVTL